MRVLVCLLLCGCAKKGVPSYDNGLLELAAGFAAKETCSCVFVTERSEEICARYTRVSPNVASVRIDHEARSVTAKALGFQKTTARLISEELGCELDRPKR